MKIIFTQFLAINALYMEREMVNYTTTESLMETTTEVPCDWPWAKHHAFAIAGCSIGLLLFPICMCCIGFRRGGIGGGSYASEFQR